MSAILDWVEWYEEDGTECPPDDALAMILDQEVLPLVSESPAESLVELARLMDDYEVLKGHAPPVLSVMRDAEGALLRGDQVEAVHLLNLIIHPKWPSRAACEAAYAVAMAETRAARTGEAQ